MSLNTIEEAIEDIKAGKVVIVVDDEDRENEGDFVAAASPVGSTIVSTLVRAIMIPLIFGIRKSFSSTIPF